jgi:protein transport protein SEC23
MKDMVQLTGGLVVQIDTFTNVVFKESLKRMFAKEGEEGFLGMSAHATLEVLPSRDIKVSFRRMGHVLFLSYVCLVSPWAS